MEAPLLSTKNVVPLVPAEFVHRPRLIERINRGAQGPLTLLAAPAGFGKTSALAEWAQQSRLAIAWLTLNPEDNDRFRFARYLNRALDALSPGLGEDSLAYLLSSQSATLEQGMTLLINGIAALPTELAIVLDEYHVITETRVHDGVNFVLTHRPHNLHLVIASRGQPALDLAFLRAKGWVLELGVNDLRFTGDEVAQFANQAMGLELPPEAVRALAEGTEGWAAGLQLAALSSRYRADPSMPPAGPSPESAYLGEFLAQEVLDRQPEEVRQFLLRSAILEALSGPLCEAVVAPDQPLGYGTRMLRRLYAENLFLTPLDEQHHWYRYHRLFGDFLLQVQTETHAAEMPELHRRAAEWLEAHSRYDEAFEHAVASGDPDWAATLMERNEFTLAQRGELEILTHWTRRLPPAIVRAHPELCLAYTWGLIQARQLDEARLLVVDVERALASFPDQTSGEAPPAPRDEARLRWLRGGLAAIRSLFALLSGNMEQAREYSRAALQDLPDDYPFRSTAFLDRGYEAILLGDTSQAIEALREAARVARRMNELLVAVLMTCQLAEMQALQGQLSQALATLDKARLLALRPDGSPLPLAGIVENVVGDILRERDQLKDAREHLERGVRLTLAWWTLSSMDGMVSLARLLQSQGDLAGSQALITEASRLALSGESTQWDSVYISALATRLALQRHDPAAAAQWSQKSPLREAPSTSRPEGLPYHVFEYFLLTEARFRYAVGQDTGDEAELHRSLKLLEAIQPEVEQFKRVTSKIESLILQALVKYELGEAEQAVQDLLGALALGEPEGYRRIFLDEGRVMAALLARCLARPPARGAYLPSRPYLQSLLEASQREAGLGRQEAAGLGPQSAAPASTEQPLEPASARTPEGVAISLSAREVEVLALIAEGRSNQEISAKLYLALNTVKRHVYNIFTKLDVKNRTQAVSRARHLGLIP